MNVFKVVWSDWRVAMVLGAATVFLGVMVGRFLHPAPGWIMCVAGLGLLWRAQLLTKVASVQAYHRRKRGARKDDQDAEEI